MYCVVHGFVFFKEIYNIHVFPKKMNCDTLFHTLKNVVENKDTLSSSYNTLVYFFISCLPKHRTVCIITDVCLQSENVPWIQKQNFLP